MDDCRRLRPGDVGGQTRFPVGTLDQTVPDSRGYGNFGPLGCLFAVGKAAQLSGSRLIIRPDVQSGQFHRSRDHYHLLLARNFPIRPERAILIAANDPELSQGCYFLRVPSLRFNIRKVRGMIHIG